MASPITWQSIAAPNFSSSNSSSTSGQRNFNDSLDSFGKASTNLNNTLTGIDDTARKENTGKLAASLFGKSDAEVQAIMEGIPADANIDNNAIFEIAGKQRMDNSVLAQQASATAGNVIQNGISQLNADNLPTEIANKNALGVDALTQSNFNTSNQQDAYNLDKQSKQAGITRDNAVTANTLLQGQQTQQSLNDRKETDAITNLIPTLLAKASTTDANGRVTVDKGMLNDLIMAQKDENGKPIPRNGANVGIAIDAFTKNQGIDATNASNAEAIKEAAKVEAAKLANSNTVDAAALKKSYESLRTLANTNNDGWSDETEQQNRDEIYARMSAALSAGIPEKEIVKFASDANINSNTGSFGKKSFDDAVAAYLKTHGNNANTQTSSESGKVTANSLRTGFVD